MNRTLKLFFATLAILSTISAYAEKVVDFNVDGNTVTLSSNQPNPGTLTYQVLGGKQINQEFSNNGKISLEIKEILSSDDELICQNAYSIAQNGYVPIRFVVGEYLDTTIKAKFELATVKPCARGRILDTDPSISLLEYCTPTTREELFVKESKQWMFLNDVPADDEIAEKMAQYINYLKNTGYYFYNVVNENIPVASSYTPKTYHTQANFRTQYYYLFAASNYSNLKKLIAREISNNFSSSVGANMPIKSQILEGDGGLLIMYLVGLNDDWSSEIAPVAITLIDNSKPKLYCDGNFSEDIHLNELVYIPELKIKLNNTVNLPCIDGWAHISTGAFTENDVPFTISFSGDVKDLTIKKEVRESSNQYRGKKKVSLASASSPIHFLYELDLASGDNYIPITLTDLAGNETTISYYILK